MTTQDELEKTQLEIARLQLEQERHKLAQMQRRQGAVDGLGRGAAAVGGAAVKGSATALRWLAKALIVWAAILTFLSYQAAKRLDIASDDFLFRLGYAAGSLSPVEVFISLVIAVAAGFARWTKA